MPSLFMEQVLRFVIDPVKKFIDSNVTPTVTACPL